MLAALVSAARTSRTTVRVIRIPAVIAPLIAVRRRARGLRVILRMVLGRMRGWMRCLYMLLPERPRRVHASSAVHAPSAIRPLRRSRLRAQQQQRREKQPHRQRE